MYEAARANVAERNVRIAVSFYGKKYTFERIFRYIDLLADNLAAEFSLKKGDTVTLCAPNSPQALIAFYAANKLGVKVNLVHPYIPPEKLSESMERTGSKLLFVYDLYKGDADAFDVPVLVSNCGAFMSGAAKIYYRLTNKRTMRGGLCFEKYLKESTQNLEGLKASSIKPAQSKESKTQKTSMTESKIESSEAKEAKKSAPKTAPNTTELLAASLSPEALKSQESTTLAKAPKDTPLAQALKAAQDQGTKGTQEKQALQDMATNLAPKPVAAINPSDSKTLEDVQNLAKEKGLNPAAITALETQEVAQKPKRTPESAKQKIEYEAENAEDRVAVINRGRQKPKNITSKISNIYEESKAEQGSSTLGSMLGLKDLPRQI